MMDHVVQKISSDHPHHWAISATMSPMSAEKGDVSPYRGGNIDRLESLLTTRAADKSGGRPKLLSMGKAGEEYCNIKDTSSTASDSGAFSATSESGGNDDRSNGDRSLRSESSGHSR